MKFIFDSGKASKSGRTNPESVAGFNRNTRQLSTGIGGRFAPDFPVNEMKLNPKISAQILSNKVGISKRKIEENIAKLKNMNIIIREGGTRGYWEVRDTGST